MCTYYYLHYHHIYPCTRDIEFVIHYIYCQDATFDQATQTQQPCPNISYHDQANGNPGIDFTNPCASGGCLASPDCSLGRCRLQELGGLWICCRCGFGGNRYPCCYHLMRRSPDSLCYHQCCQDCQPDLRTGAEAQAAAAKKKDMTKKYKKKKKKKKK
ncbi:hypothetical protein M406DRAFT_343443 [Cryphonectria parasitica EP155]|uniref:Uncharacterized protein n=1 Tax=Cryphonectria parasitica (strain ATCC 38755 / EP155) TaxID=660469 RepID=A0A9P4XSX9_CRYP1|nr:uncharacterized protein M406DRAFT_343443 [Cryphonectria parasitica EP155]KAF3760328.1 hypothetical protein M406DRAFT_343443 [Cryphonectria parasitica EP155]